MEVLSPVGRFPVKLEAAAFREGRVTLRSSMGAWRSEVRLGREDLPIAAGALAALLVAFAAGRVWGVLR